MNAENQEITGEFEKVVGSVKESTKAIGDAYYVELYSNIYSLARSLAPGRTLGPTALVNEVYIKLSRLEKKPEDRRQFLYYLTRTMRNIVIDYHRTRSRRPQAIENDSLVPDPKQVGQVGGLDPLALEEALTELDLVSPEQARAAELRLFAELRIAEIAELLGISTATVERRWKSARAFIKTRLE